MGRLLNRILAAPGTLEVMTEGQRLIECNVRDIDAKALPPGEDNLVLQGSGVSLHSEAALTWRRLCVVHLDRSGADRESNVMARQEPRNPIAGLLGRLCGELG